ncbi:MAG: ABC transporter substrate-binding protein [Alphaproteobacteria bacterium]|jgi:peptide/nickel transport system substrate-binding protein|nr:ABC transporter substrate-binding protein [Alphaproteobacteria bacterium]
MRKTSALLTGAALIALTVSGGAAAETLRFAFQGDVNTLDPHSLNETFTLGYQGNIYEGLTRRGPDLTIEPALATGWEIIEPTRWRFFLREDVTFHNGNPFTAEDVVFTFERTQAEGSDLRTRVAGIEAVEIVDEHTVDFVTEVPNPILNFEWDTWYIMDKEWAEANNATMPTNVSDANSDNYANLNANGTGPFMVTERVPDVRTVALPNPDWWDEATHNLTEVVFQPISSDSTRVAALLSGEMDMVFPIPLQDLDRVDSNEGTRALTGPELRTIFLGMDQARDELLYSDVTGENPFKDRRVREAFYRAIDIQAIQRIVMRGNSTPTAAMVAPGVNGFPENIERYPHDPEMARDLLAEAGYPDGFEVTMDCPNDRYVNDEEICTAIVGMLGQVGVTIDLLAQPRSIYFGKVLAQGGYDTSFYLLGWTPGSFDSWNVLYNIVGSREESGRGAFNLGGYSNPELDALTDQILVETDLDRRAELINQAWQLEHETISHIPLHQQALAWGAADNVELAQRADNQFHWRHVTMGE